MLSLCESEVLQEYNNRLKSEMTENEKKRIKYVNKRKREELKKAAQKFQIREMIPLKDYKKMMQMEKELKKQQSEEEQENQNSKNGGRKR